MKMRKWFIFCFLVAAIFWLRQPLQGFENELAIYSNPALSPDERQIAFECRDWNTGMEAEYDSLRGSDIFLVDIKGSNLRQMTFYADCFYLSPDKSKVILQTYYGMYLLDLEKRSNPIQIFNRFPDNILDGRYGSVEQISWSPSSKKFFFARAIGINWERKYSILDVESLEERVFDTNLGNFWKGIQWIDDSTIIFEKDNELLSYNYLTRQGELLASGYPNESCTNPLMSPDKQKMLYQYTDQYKIRLGSPYYKDHRQRPQKIVICEVKDLPDWAAEELTKRLWSGEERPLKKTDYLLLDGSISQVKVSWFRDSQRLLIKGLKELWIYDLSDSSYVPLFLDSIPISEAVMTTDQSKIFFISSFFGDRNGDGRIKSDENFSDLKVYDFRTKECRIIINHSEPSAQLNLSPSGNLLAFVKANNIWILNTESEKFYQLTFDGGINPQWMVKDQSILFSSNGSLVKLDLDANKWNYLTLGRGVEPNWINKKEIVVKSRGKFWQVSVDKIGVKELQKYPDNLRLTKGKSYEVYIDEVKLEPRSMNVTEVKARDLKTSQCWVIKPPWCNFPWAFKK